MKNPTSLWRDIAYRFAEQSKCLSRRVGCVIITPDDRLVGQGYNSAPQGSKCDDCVRCRNGKSASGDDLDLAICSHAEANAIGYAARMGISTRGCTLYCTTRPCSECAKLIVTAGIVWVVYFEDYKQSWCDVAGSILRKAGVFESMYKDSSTRGEET